MKRWVLAISIGLWGFLGTSVWAYTEMSVANGGTVSGNVVLQGSKPAPLAYNLVTFPDPAYCGQVSTGTGWRLFDEFQVSKEGGLKNAVVLLEGIEAGKPFPVSSPQIMAKDCTFSPRVVVVQNKQTISVVNMDPIIHDVQIYETAPFGTRVMSHRPLPMNPYHRGNKTGMHEHRPGRPLVDMIEFSHGRRIFFLECGFHAFMQVWGVAVNNPYYAVTDENGHFTISEIPEGVYSLLAWHPGVHGLLQMQVVILGHKNLKTKFIFDAPPVHHDAHTTMVKHPKYGMNVFGKDLHIQPTHEIQAP